MVPKRAFWAATGYAAGFGTSIWAVRKAKAAARRFAPSEVVTRTAASAGATTRRIGDALGDAFTEGRDVMRSREAEMRAGIEARGVKSSIPEPGADEDLLLTPPLRANLRLVEEGRAPLELESESGAQGGRHISKRASIRARRNVR